MSRVRTPQARGRRSHGLLALAISLVGTTLLVRAAKADEPLRGTEPTLMAEPGEVVDVVDAFDTKNNDPFDLNLSVGFHQSWELGRVQRESNVGPDGLPSSSGFVHNIENIAAYQHATSVLNLRADIGVWRDIALFVRLPVILADKRKLDELDGSGAGVNAINGRIADPATGAPIFRLPFTSPDRSGVDYLALGVRWSIYNQFRDATKPTWTWEIEGRFAIGEFLRACNTAPEQVPVEVGGNGQRGNYPSCPGSTADASMGPIYSAAAGRWYRNPLSSYPNGGISRGVDALRIATLVSNRFRYVEPYGGFWFMAEFQRGSSAIGDRGDLQGIITNHPPLQGGLVGGLQLHPWENREDFQRFTIDLRFDAKYVSQGRDYSPLFDALGSTTNASSLIANNPGFYRAGQIGVDPRTNQPIFGSVGNYNNAVSFTGVTDVEPYGVYGAHVSMLLQAARYIRFHFGGGLSYMQSHAITAADACNPAIVQTDANAAGPCRSAATQQSTGTPNPYHRALLDLPGRRFLIADALIWDVWVTGTVMF